MAEKSASQNTNGGKRRPGSTTGRMATTGELKKARASQDGSQRRAVKTDVNSNFADAAPDQKPKRRRRRKVAPSGAQAAKHASPSSTSAGKTSAGKTSAGRTSADAQTPKLQAKPKGKGPAHGAAHTQKSAKNTVFIGGIVGVAVILVLIVGSFVFACTRPVTQDAASGQTSEANNGAATSQGAASLSFCAVGANIANADILKSADAWGGTAGDGIYDFSPLYTQISPIVAQYDVSFISQGSTLGGHTNFEYQGYPSYNTPDSMADAIEGAGFKVANTNTNHTYDMWVDAITHSQSVWAQHPNVVTVGSYNSAEDRGNIRVMEKNGLKVAILSYSYGQNGYTQDQLPNDYYAAPFNKDTMRAEVERAKELADAVVVYMHWNETDVESGSTDTSILSDEQQNYASYLAGLGVDLVIGCRGQSIQPVRYVGRGIRTTDGSGVTPANGMLCVYGLGDFVSAYTLPSAVLSGMFTCDFVRDANGEVSVQNPVWHGLVEHRSGNVDCVYPLASYTAELAGSNELLARLNQTTNADGTTTANATTVDPLQWARDTTTQTVGSEITVEV